MAVAAPRRRRLPAATTCSSTGLQRPLSLRMPMAAAAALHRRPFGTGAPPPAAGELAELSMAPGELLPMTVVHAFAHETRLFGLLALGPDWLPVEVAALPQPDGFELLELEEQLPLFTPISAELERLDGVAAVYKGEQLFLHGAGVTALADDADILEFVPVAASDGGSDRDEAAAKIGEMEGAAGGGGDGAGGDGGRADGGGLGGGEFAVLLELDTTVSNSTAGGVPLCLVTAATDSVLHPVELTAQRGGDGSQSGGWLARQLEPAEWESGSALADRLHQEWMVAMLELEDE
eukprot:SAG22_NODE_2239_length_2803_cov_2.755917_1_plen_292_part_00